MENNSIVKFIYEATPISFSNDESIMINATEMAKSFGKKPNDWLRLPSTKEFIDVLSSARKSRSRNFEPYTTIPTSPENGGGTWMHRDVALEFARWLSPLFAIWCNDRIIELLSKKEMTMTTTMHLNENKEIYVLPFGKIFANKESINENKEKTNKFFDLDIENKNGMLAKKLSPMTLKELTEFINENVWDRLKHSEDELLRNWILPNVKHIISSDEKIKIFSDDKYNTDANGDILIMPRQAISILDNINYYYFITKPDITDKQ